MIQSKKASYACLIAAIAAVVVSAMAAILMVTGVADKEVAAMAVKASGYLIILGYLPLSQALYCAVTGKTFEQIWVK